MRKFLIGVVAVAGVALATPALSQIYLGAGPGGVGIGVGPGPGYYEGGYEGGYAPRYQRSYGYDRGYARCRTRLVETRHGMRRVRRCY
jgi:hypothetical protein